MNQVRESLPKPVKDFFYKLSDYLDTELYFSGSINRSDYIHGQSDIDVAIFTDNINNIILKLQSFLSVNQKDFKQFVWMLNYDNILVKGYKIIYKEPERNFAVEFSLCDEKYKDGILIEHNGKTNLPFYATYALIFIKYLFYQFNIIPPEWYVYLKKIILHKMIFLMEHQFVVL